MNKLMLLVAATLAGCATVKTPNPANGDCKEFVYKTVNQQGEVLCHMLWCQGMTASGTHSGGLATLWCEEIK